MNDSPTSNDPARQLPPSRQPSTRPPIQWPVRSGATSDVEREKAAQIARGRVDRLYTQSGEPNQAPNPDVHTDSHIHSDQHSRTAINDQGYDWQHYHAAWQQYYHQYFYRYYAGWWQQQKQQIETEAAQHNQPSPEEDLTEKQRVAKELREKVRSTVEKQSKKVKSSSHFKPLLASVFVGSTFLLVNYNQVLVGAIKQYIAPGSIVTTPVIVEPGASNTVGQDPKIIIPKIGVEAPVVYDVTSVEEAAYQAGLERGVVRLGTTADPGTKGNVVIGGHSSNNVFNAGKYKYVFVNLKRLDVGDIFYLNYKGQRYTYKITVAKKIITPTETDVLAQTEKPTVTLFTCDPPGTNVNRLIVQAEQIDPSPAAATTNTNQPTAVNKKNPLPSVAPSLLDRLFN
jgi:sortase A